MKKRRRRSSLSVVTVLLKTKTVQRFFRKSLILSLFLILSLSTATSFPQQHDGGDVVTTDPNLHTRQASKTTTTTTFLRQRGDDVGVEPDARERISRSRHLHLQPPTEVASLALIDGTHAEYKRRKEEWADRYTTLEGLRRAFGSNRNKIWGDLDATTSRRLYKSLLPNALCELVLQVGMRPEELAPLAYQARKAAKLYARERCHLPARIAAQLFDGYRQWKTYGRFQVAGMSYDQIWNKYRKMVLHEAVSTKRMNSTITIEDSACSSNKEEEEDHDEDEEWTEEDIVIQTCLKILERSCTTNERIDRMLLNPQIAQDVTTAKATRRRGVGDNDNAKSKSKVAARQQLMEVAKTLEDDVRKLLEPTGLEVATTSVKDQSSAITGGSGQHPNYQRSEITMTRRQYKALKHFAMARRRNVLEALESDVLLPPSLWNSTVLPF